MRIKRSEVAKNAGVSEATVSYVFSEKRYVSPDLVKRVKDVAEELDYHPDMIARSMVTNETRTIGILTNDIASPLQMQIVKGIQSAAMDKGYFVNICGGTTNLESYVDNFISRRIDGIFISVISSLVSEKYLQKLLNRGISVMVTSTRKVLDDRICGLELDFGEGLRMLARHLKELNHKKIAYLSCFDFSYADDKRLSSFYSIMDSEFNEKNPLVVCGTSPFDSTIESGYNLMQKLLKKTRDFTAVICSNDLMAFGAISALRENNLDTPSDVSVAGMDDILFAKAFNPPLTTISHSCENYGHKIFDILYDNIQNKSVVRREVIEPTLIRRGSTALAKEKKGK